MNDPHVEKLYYDLSVDSETLEFKDPAPISGSEQEFDWTLADGVFEAEMRTHYSNVSEARQPVDALLDSYVMYHELHNQGGFSFLYRDAKIIDQDSPPVEPGSVRVITARATATGVSGGSVHATVVRHAYPIPPDDFYIDPDVRSMWHRYQMYLAGQDQLNSMVYFCLTVLECATGEDQNAREKAAQMCGISTTVLQKVGKISNQVGTDVTARKAKGKRKHDHDRPHTAEECRFMEEVVKQMIERMAYRAAIGWAPEPRLTLDDLPRGTGLLA